MKILIVGFGSIGFRHFQSLKKHFPTALFFVFDVTPIDLIKERFVHGENIGEELFDNVEWMTSLEDSFGLTFDFILLTTIATDRGQTLFELSKLVSFDAMLIEKPLTNTVTDLQYFNLIPCDEIYVNHHRRYQAIHRELQKMDLNINCIEFKSASLGLLCNFSHHIDFARMLQPSCGKIKEINLNFLTAFPARREGMIEVDGHLGILFENGLRLNLNNMRDSPVGKQRICEITTDEEVFVINESAGILTKDDEIVFESKLLNQSDLTSKYLEDIGNGVCKLPTLSVCLDDHKVVLQNIEHEIQKYAAQVLGNPKNARQGWFT